MTAGVRRVLHLSDTHLTGTGALHQGLVDTTAALGHALESLHGVGPLDVVVVSGDVSDDGTVASYATARALVGDFAARHGALAVFAMGNHDVAVGFTEVLGPVRSVHDAAGLRVVVLDSSVPGRGYGALPAGQLAWLRSVLADPAPLGSVVVVHHGPVRAPTVLHEALELQDAGALLAALEGTDVRAVLCGHYHHPFVRVLPTGVPVVVAPGVANRTDPLVVRGRERAVRGSGACLVEFGAGGEPGGPGRDVLVSVLDVPTPGDGQELFELDEAAVTRIAAEAGTPGPD